MGKLVIKYQGKQVGEINLKLGDMKIGRKPDCDIVIADPAVSGDHAVIKTVGLRSTIQDLGSKNGTFVESKPVQQHELRHGETISVGEHTLIYRDDFGLDKAAPGQRPGLGARAAPENATVVIRFAQLLGVEGKEKGKRIPFVKDNFTIDNPGKNPARISRVPHGYVLEAQVGPGEPRINDKPVPPGGHVLEGGDIIEVAGTQYRFLS